MSDAQSLETVFGSLVHPKFLQTGCFDFNLRTITECLLAIIDLILSSFFTRTRFRLFYARGDCFVTVELRLIQDGGIDEELSNVERDDGV